MGSSQKKTPVWILLTVAVILIVSCILQPTVNPTAIPVTPTENYVGPYEVFVKEDINGIERILSNAEFWFRGTRLGNVIFDAQGYHADCAEGEKLLVWVENYFIEQVDCNTGEETLDVSLRPYTLTDNANYIWVGSNECIECHVGKTDELTGRYHNEFAEWQKDSHSNSFRNPYFQSVYLGTKLDADQAVFLNQKVAPGFLIDYADDYGSCGFCHVPAVLDPPQLEANLESFFGSQPYPATDGVTCDVCHKVVSVNLQMTSAYKDFPYHDRPGVLSYNFLRPDIQTQRVYVGPRVYVNLNDFAEIDSPDSKIAYSPIFEKGEFCAPCHYGKFWDPIIYNSYGEWRDSAYYEDGTTCQDCHMKSRYLCDDNSETVISQSEYTHDMTVEDCMLRKAATMGVKVNYEAESDQISVAVTLINENAGHKFPTDSPLRHLILVVEARDQNNNILHLARGETIPLWGGVGNVAGKPGKIFANILIEEAVTERFMNISPTIAYWNKTKPAWKNSDTRLKPKIYNSENKVEVVADVSQYFFAAPFKSAESVKITVNLYYRYAFFDLMVQKGWNRPDVLLKTEVKVMQLPK